MNEHELKKLVQKAQQGSADAFGQLYVYISDESYRFALYYLKNEADAEDAVQDAAVKAYTHIKELKKAEAFRSWYFKILSNTCKTRFRGADIILYDEIPDLAVTPESTESQTELKELLFSLPDSCRRIVVMSVLGRFKSAEIAEELGINANTVRSRLSRALHILRQQLE